MKRINLFVLFVFITLMLCSCGSQKTEYTMTELEGTLKEINAVYNEKIKDLTSTEIEEKGEKIKIEEAQKQGLPLEKEITVRGKVYASYYNDSLFLAANKYDDYSEYNFNTINCFLSKPNDKLMFLKQDENVLIKGILAKNKEGLWLSDCELISPEIEVPDFNNNISEINSNASSYQTDVLVYGSVLDMVSCTELKTAFLNSFKDIDYQDTSFLTELENSDYCVELKSTDSEDYIFWFINKSSNYINQLQQGQNVCVKANINKTDDTYIHYISSAGGCEGLYIYD